MTETASVPNHHAHYPGFVGPSGLLAALSMIKRRDRDARLAARLCRVGPDDVVVDVGCGPGAAARFAAGLGATVTGVDPAAVMRRVASLLSWRARRVRYVEGTAEALPIADGVASVVWSIACVHHWADIDAGLRESRRVLRGAGVLCAIERRIQPDAHGLASHGWTEAQADAFAERARTLGFVDVRVEANTTDGRSTLAVLATAPSA